VELNARLVLDKKLTRQEIKLNTLNKYVQQHPTGWKKRLELARLLYSIGRWEEAIAQFRQVLKSQPRSIAVHLQLGKILHLMGRDAEAIGVYESALALAENAATQHHIAGAIAVCQGNSRQGAIVLELAVALEPNNLAHWHALGQIYLSLEDPIWALKAFDAILAIDPDDIVALNSSYDLLLAAGNFAAAQQRLDKALALAPQEFPTLKRLANRLLSLGLVWDEDGKQTKRTIQTLLQLAPHAADAEELLASYYIRRGEPTTGIDRLHKFVEQRPHNPHGWYYYARCLDRTGDPQAAADAILKAYKLYPNDAEIYRAMCDILPAAGRLDELKPLIEEMLQRFPERWSLWATAGRVLVKCFQDVERGCNTSAQGTEIQPNLADSWFQHGRVLALAGRHQAAVEALERGWKLLPTDGECSRSLPAGVWLSESYRALGDESASRYWSEQSGDRAQELMEFCPATAGYWQGRALQG
jgi:tetratricopeptide (TPR) repeat protein